MLLRVGIEPLEKLRGGRVLELDGRNEPKDVIPMLLDERHVDVFGRQDLEALLLIYFPRVFGERINCFGLEILEAWSDRKSEQMCDAKNDLGIPVGVCGVVT